MPQGHQQCLQRQPSAVDCGVFLAVLTSDLCTRRYQHTVRVCALQDDLSSLPYGDLTEVSRAGSSAPQQHTAAWLPGPQGGGSAGPAPSTSQAPRGPRRCRTVRSSRPDFAVRVCYWGTPQWIGHHLHLCWVQRGHCWGHSQAVCHLREGFWPKLLVTSRAGSAL